MGGSPRTNETDRTAVTARLQQLLARRVRGDQVEQLARFARGLTGRVGGLVETLDDEAASAMAWSSFQFFRGPGELPRVRVVSPTYVSDGWDAPVTLIETVMVDRAFIVDTLQGVLAAHGLPVRSIVHPIFAARRDETGALERLGAPLGGDRRESFVQLALPRCTDAAQLARLEQEIRDRIADVTLVTDDFPLMLARAQQVAGELESLARAKPDQRTVEATAVAEFMRWLVDGALVFLGYREYAVTERDGTRVLALRPGSGLGLLRREQQAALAAPQPLDALPERVREWLTGPALLTMEKTIARSPVHRAERMDNVGVKEFDAEGRVVGERRFLGLLTSQGHVTESSEVPLLRRMLRQILAAEEVVAGSHDHKAFVEIFNSLPKGELFASSPADVREDMRAILAARQSQDVTVSVRQRPQRVTVLVMMPTARFSGAARTDLDELVQAHIGGPLLEDDLVVGDDDHARLHYAFAPGSAPLAPAAVERLRDAIVHRLRSWPEQLADALADARGTSGTALAQRWATAFPRDYQAATPAERALADVEFVATASAGSPAIALLAGEPGSPYSVLRLVTVGSPLVLADALPVFDGFGLRVLGEDTVTVQPAGEPPRFLLTFTVQDRHGRALDTAAVAERLVDALRAVLAGTADADGLNRLVLEAGLDLRGVQTMRAYAGWAVQAGLAGRTAIRAALTAYPESTAALFACVAARFQPGATDAGARAAFVATLERVDSLRDDGILRGVADAVEATVRSTAFTRDLAAPVVLKLRSAAIAWLPRPLPLFEIYVLGRGVEGVHLRAGRIARGGIRASDRLDDLRTEVLGLMKTQTVKNAVIVPTGAKGGFVVRGAAGARPTKDETLAAYKIFIESLLDVSDDIVGDRVVSPRDLLCYDEDDPYLVVAADKGTATFSDVANAIAVRRGFWLGDAFASGGSAGYDHKALGITARGAWECVRTHARALGLDADTAPLRVAGIGDPSGDVFGNGLLCSRAVRLVAAFNHQHVFLDPDPDPARSYAERRRLFDAVAGWGAYEPSVLSPGGMIVERAAKRVALSPQVQQLLGVSEPALSGEALVRAVLGLDVDLLFNGGVGTYVKAESESHADVGDPANDTVRVDAGDVRARIVSEGGNLGLTPRARVALALAGRHLNTDAIDNSAGVDCSDHEVNLKICLAPLLAAQTLDLPGRDALLAEVTDDVVERVLVHNRRQSRRLGVDQLASGQRLEPFVALQSALEKSGGLDRVLAVLPDADTLRARAATTPGYTRPELAELLAHAKLQLQATLLASSLPDDPLLQPYLIAYFPAAVVTRARAAVETHRLRREIVATEVANHCVDRMGMTFVQTTSADLGVAPSVVLRAWAIAWTAADAERVAQAVEGAGLSLDVETAAVRGLERAAARVTAWVMAHTDASGSAAPVARDLATALEPLRAGLADWVTAGEAEQFQHRVTELEFGGVPTALARDLATMDWLPDLLDVAGAAAPAGLGATTVAARYFGLAEHVDFAWLLAQLDAVEARDGWALRAAGGLAADVRDARQELARLGLHAVAPAAVDRLRTAVRELRAQPRVPLAALAVLTHDLRRLVATARKGG